MKQTKLVDAVFYTKQLLILKSYLDGKLSKNEYLDRIHPYFIEDLVEILLDEKFESSEEWNEFEEEWNEFEEEWNEFEEAFEGLVGRLKEEAFDRFGNRMIK